MRGLENRRTELEKEWKGLVKYKLRNTRKPEGVRKVLLISKAGNICGFSYKSDLKENPGEIWLRKECSNRQTKIAEESSCHTRGKTECCGHNNRPHKMPTNCNFAKVCCLRMSKLLPNCGKSPGNCAWCSHFTIHVYLYGWFLLCLTCSDRWERHWIQI